MYLSTLQQPSAVCYKKVFLERKYFLKVLKKNQQIHTYQVVPWNSELKADEHDAFFLSNGPGDPQVTIINFDQTNVAQAGLFMALLLLSNDFSIYIYFVVWVWTDQGFQVLGCT